MGEQVGVYRVREYLGDDCPGITDEEIVAALRNRPYPDVAAAWLRMVWRPHA